MNYDKIKLMKKKGKIKHCIENLEECAEILYQNNKETMRASELSVYGTIGLLKEEIKRMEDKINGLR